MPQVMSDRPKMDRPAQTTAAALGVVLLAVSLPYAVQEFAAGGAASHDIAWTAVAYPPDALKTQGAANEQVVVAKYVDDQITATVAAVMSPAQCQDTFNTQFQQNPVTLTWSMSRNGKALTGIGGTFTCADVPTSGVLSPAYTAHTAPNIGTASGSTDADAIHDAYAQADAAGLSETAFYNVTFSWNRPADGPLGGLPVAPGKSFTATMQVRATVWKAAVIETPDEVPR